MPDLIRELDILSDQQADSIEVKTTATVSKGLSRKLYVESYGCQMNFADSEIVASILATEGFETTAEIAEIGRAHV